MTFFPHELIVGLLFHIAQPLEVFVMDAALMSSIAVGSAPPKPGRSVIATRFGIVASSQPLASMAGVQILQRGGNAVDAAIGANAVVGVMEPTGNGIGGDLFAIIHESKSGKLHGLNSSGWAPERMTPEFLKAKGIEKLPVRGVYSVTVPGVVAGWAALRERFGSLPFSTLLAPAIYYADKGYPVNEVTAGLWNNALELLQSEPNATATYLIDGRTPKAGEVFRNPDLAASLRLITNYGRDGYYKGRTAEAIVAISREKGGAMAMEDLAGFEPEWVTPIATDYRGWTVYEIPPNTQGIAALMMLNLMEQFPMSDYGFHSARALHVMIEAKKLAYADMLRYTGDMRMAKVPVEQMLSKRNAAERAGLIGERALASVQPSRLAGVTDGKGNDTIYLTVIDTAGDIVSLIQSNYMGFGSGLVPRGAGFMLQNRGSLFSLDKSSPNLLAGHKRPLHTIIPGFMQKGDVRIGFGIMGGWNQAQAHAQFVANIVDYGMSLQQALEAGRFTKSTFEGCDVQIEELVPQAVRDELTRMGHELEVKPVRTNTFGFGQAVMSNGTGVHFGASDPRHDGAAIPEPGPVFSDAKP
jgi:gamma-glutamyltranspeptidase/glutathione hydrolase